MTKRILILDDDAGVRAAALRRLDLPSCEAVAVVYAGDPDTLAHRHRADLIALGGVGAVGNPSSRLRETLRIPVLPLFRPSVYQRSRAGRVDLSPGLLLGLSDCRIRIGQHLEARAMPSEMAVRWGDFTLKLEAGAFAFRGERLGLTKVQAALLSLLMHYSGEIVGTDVIEDVIFRGKPKSQTNFISVHISRLRARLRETRGDIFIESVRNCGYALFWNSSFSSRRLPTPELFVPGNESSDGVPAQRRIG
jgi:DNA-binding winged helix-turn-helix (wHTH) protein